MLPFFYFQLNIGLHDLLIIPFCAYLCFTVSLFFGGNGVVGMYHLHVNMTHFKNAQPHPEHSVQVFPH